MVTGAPARPPWSRRCVATGATNRIGRVEDGTTVTDFEPEETRKHISVSLAAPVEHDGFKINLLDAPGYADFIGDVRSALPAADAVLFVVSAVEGVETQTEVVWTMAEELGMPRAFFINKLDRDRASSPAAWTASRPPSARPARPVPAHRRGARLPRPGRPAVGPGLHL